jgi:hypothetical protein
MNTTVNSWTTEHRRVTGLFSRTGKTTLCTASPREELEERRVSYHGNSRRGARTRVGPGLLPCS